MEDLLRASPQSLLLLPACKLLRSIKKHFLKTTKPNQNPNICALRRGGKNIFKALQENSQVSLWY